MRRGSEPPGIVMLAFLAGYGCAMLVMMGTVGTGIYLLGRAKKAIRS